MNLKEFFNSLNGKYIDVDGAGSKTNKNQCVDVVKAYCNRVFGVPISKMNGYGDAWEYYTNFSSKSAITPYFNKMAYTKGFKFRAGDIVVWKREINSINAGHIAVATGKYTSSIVETFDQNFPGKSPCHFETHSYSKINGVLRPKDYSKITGDGGGDSLVSTGRFPTPVKWQNGSTKETVFKQNDLREEIGTISKRESALCYSKSGDSYVVVYNLDGTDKHKAGFVEYAGGVDYAPPESKTYKNGSTPEIVYTDTAKRTKAGSLDINETCYCLGKIDGMYLVLYKVNGTSIQKCGFVSYSGGLD